MIVYNEIEPFAASWLRNLSDAGHIATGSVDVRSIRDLRADDVVGATQFHTFAGLGAWSHALRLAGWPDDRPVWTGSCPCQPFSGAGLGGGFDDPRHLWPDWFRLIRECRPPVVFGEQVASNAGLAWFDLVRADLEGEGYAVGAADLCAAGVGAPHLRQRLYFVAYTERHEWRQVGADVGWRRGRSDPEGVEQRPPDGGHVRPAAPGPVNGFWADAEWLPCRNGRSRAAKPGTFPLAHGTTSSVGRLRAYGNAIVPQVAAAFVTAFCEAGL